MGCITPYEPLGVPKPFAEAVWIVDGPEIRMRSLGLPLPFPTRATIVRLPDGGLWVHSPVAIDSGLKQALDRLGPVRWLIAPNTLHVTWIADWKALWPDARVCGVPRLRRRRGLDPHLFDGWLDDRAPAAWGRAFDQMIVTGDLLSEAVFLHRPSRTLILTDLIENFELGRICRPWRWLVRLSGAADPDGKAPIDMQWSFWRRRRVLRDQVRRLIAWAPERIVMAHGRPYDRDGVAELTRAFRWVLR